MAANFARFGAFFRDNNVRVVNMSWGDQVSEFEQWLAKTDPTSDPQARKAKAQQLYAIWRSAIEDMIKNTPGTLFVAAAGTATMTRHSLKTFRRHGLSQSDRGRRGQSGRRSDELYQLRADDSVYADGYHVLSKIPRGYAVRFSGTSMASPNVTNLAGKLFALDPSLTPEQVRALIVNGATPIPAESSS